MKPGNTLALRFVVAALGCFLFASSAQAFTIRVIAGKEFKWDVSNVGYYIDANGWSGISSSSDTQAVIASFNEWQSVNCSFLTFSKLGTTNTTNVIPTGAEPNGKNEFIWKEGYWPFGSSVLGITGPISGYDAEIFEADIAMNGTIQWSTTGGTMWTATDVKSVAIHEIGHLFGLQHVLEFSDSNPPTMAPYVDPYGKTASLHNDDKNGICFLYPAVAYTCSSNMQCPYVMEEDANGNEYYSAQYKCQGGSCILDPNSLPSGNNDVGGACASDANCKAGLFCVMFQSGNYCTKWCEGDSACPSNFICAFADPTADEGMCVNTGSVTDGNFGDYCFQDGDCKSDLCISWILGDFCSKLCADPVGGSGCPANYTCYAVDEAPSGKGACIPGTTSKKENGESCEASTQCKSALCFANPGSSSLYCRESCNPAQGNCSQGYKCVPQPGDVTGTKGGCVPIGLLPEKKEGQSCAADWECKSAFCHWDSELGQSLCRSLCTPGVTTCPSGTACLDLGGGKAACLPSTGDPKPDGSTCAHHYDCISGVCEELPGTGLKYCRKACTISGGCPAGFDCVLYTDTMVGVCMPQGKAPGEVCFSSLDCTTQICWAESGTALCLYPCVVGGCPAGYECVSGTTYGDVCVETPGTFATGTSCVGDSQCMSGICMGGLCREGCNVLQPLCPEGQGCVPINNGPEGACVVLGGKNTGALCTADFECASLLCTETPGEGRFCVIPCAPGSATCPTGQECVEPAELSGLGACVPEAEVIPDPPVTEPDDDDHISGSRGGDGCLNIGPPAQSNTHTLLALIILLSLTALRRGQGC